MKRIQFFAVMALATVFAFTSCQKEEEATLVQEDAFVDVSENGKIIPGQYIVVFNNTNKRTITGDYTQRQEIMGSEVQAFLSEFTRNKAAITASNVYSTAIHGFSAELNAEMVELMRADSRVKSIEPNRIVVLGKPVKDPPAADPQVTPWGITRVNGGVDGTGRTAWVIDTGIDFDHPDLNVDVARSMTFVRSKSADDDHGHGSHCAGTIAAIDNDFGVVGVAANATVVAVKVLDRRGSGDNAGVIAGVDYVAANGSAGDVANMSLGGGVSTALDDAVLAAAQSSGVIFCLAAGNESDDANNHSPARVNGNNIYTISAMDINDNWAYFSNYGTPVDYAAPGYDIFSTYKDGGYGTMSGTSMACPHAAGILLLGPARTSGYVNGDPDGNADPIMTH